VQNYAAGGQPIHEQAVPEAREQLRRARQLLGPGPGVATIEELSIPGPGGEIPARRYQPAERRSPGIVVYFHGGGWVIGGIDESDVLCRSLAIASGCDIVSVGYRLAPEHPFPAAVQDAVAAVQWVASSLADGRPIVLVGDSSGGTLAAVATQRARDEGGPAIALQVLVYPATDHRMATSSYEEHGQGYLLTAEDMRWFWNQYAPDLVARDSSDASPLLAVDMAGLPPALVLVAEYDVLRDEVIAYAERLDDAGVEVTVERYEGMIHGFFPLVGRLTAAQEAVDSVGRAVAKAVLPVVP
jgi:acetyl esterase